LLYDSRKYDPDNLLAKSIEERKAPLRGNLMRNEYDFSGAKRGLVSGGSKGKTRITIRLDEDIVQWFKTQVHKAGGGNYQTLINHALREYMASTNEPFEDILRRVLREELKRAM